MDSGDDTSRTTDPTESNADASPSDSDSSSASADHDRHASEESSDASDPDGDETSGEHSQDTSESDNSSSTAPQLRALETILRRTRSSRRRTLFTEGLLWSGAALSAVLLSALLFALVLPSAVPAVPRWILLLGGGATMLGALGAGIQFVRERRSLSAMARALERAQPDFRNDIVAALEFGRRLVEQPDTDDRELGFSRTLAARQLARTVETLREHGDPRDDLAHLLPDRLLTPPLLAMVGMGSLIVATGWLAPDVTGDVLRSPWSTASSSGDGESSAEVRPIVGNVRLKYTAPSYTGRGVRTEPRSSGHIEAVEGSEVALTAVPLKGVKDIEIALETDEGKRTIPMERTQGGRVRAELVVTDKGSYQFQARLPDGNRATDGVEREIDVVSDEAPDVSITSHEGEVEVSPEDVLEIEFTVHDDYGIDKVERVHHFAGSSSEATSQPITSPVLTETPENFDGTVELNLRSLSLQPKDVVVFYLRAHDNNSATGAGTGRSDKLTLRISSPEDEHLSNIRAQKELSEELLLLLADYLEQSMGERSPEDDDAYRQVVREETSRSTLGDRLQRVREIHRREGKLLDEMNELIGQLEDDPLMKERNITLFEGVHKHLSDLHESGGKLYENVTDETDANGLDRQGAQRVADHLGQVEKHLETDILRLQELIASQKMDAIKSTQRDIKKLKNRLKQQLKRYKKTKDPELKKSIEREIKRLRQRMAELMQRMQMQIQKLPQRHLNQEALEKRKLQSQSKSLSDNLKSIEEQLENDNVEGALESLEKMGSNLDSLGQKMNKQFSGAQPKGLSKLDKKMSKLMNEANNLRSMEKKLEKKTEKIQRKQAKRRKKKVDRMLDDFIPEMLDKVDRQLNDLDEIVRRDVPRSHRQDVRKNRESLEALRANLEQQDIKRALEAARQSLDRLQTLQFNFNLSKRHARSDSDRSRALDASVERIESMVPRGETIKEKLERMMERAQSQMKRSEQQEMKKLSKRQKKIEKRAKQLKQKIEKASKEFPMLEQKLQPKLEKANKEMKQAQKRLSKGEPQGALDSERGALKKLNKLKQSMKKTIKKQKQRQQRKGGSGRQQRRESVEIPGQQDEASREELRRELMEAMKEDKLQEYEGEIQQYYKSLVE